MAPDLESIPRTSLSTKTQFIFGKQPELKLAFSKTAFCLHLLINCDFRLVSVYDREHNI